ncbi:hypothetical protein Tco_1559514, partial [Tanacetum coccineum]
MMHSHDIEIRDKKGVENLADDHLSRLENPDLEKLTKAEIHDLFPKEQLMMISDKSNEPCLVLQRAGNISARDETPQKYIQVEAQAFPTSDARNVVNFLKKLFAHFGIPKALISDR